MPDVVFNSNCNKLYADVEDVGNFVTTKLIVVLKDCKGNVLYQTAEGKSKEKEFKLVYNQALRAAFESFDVLNYHFEPSNDIKNAPANQVAKQETVVLSATFEKETLLAQPINNGFQLVDQTPKVVIKMLRTSNPAVFTATKGPLTGVILKKNEQWDFEYYENDQLKSETITIKF